MAEDHYSVVITGHTGFVGRAVAEAFDSHKITWHGVSRSNGYDLENSNALDNLPASDWVIHLAGIANVLQSWETPQASYMVNFQTTLTMLEYARRVGANVVYLSSYMYGVPEYLSVDEMHPVSCRNPYAQSKYLGELLCKAYVRDYGLNNVIIRPFNLYGPNQETHQLIPHLIRQAMEGNSITLADLQPRRDWLWVGDLANAIRAVITTPPGRSRLYNVGAGVSLSVAELVEMVQEIVGPREVICRDELRRNEIPDCVCNSHRFQEEYDWAPSVSLADGLGRLISSYGDDK